MTKYEVDYSYMLPEWGTTEVDIDPTLLNQDDKEEYAIKQIRDEFPDIEDIDIEEMRVI